MFLVNSRSAQFSAAQSGFGSKSLHPAGLPLSLSYGEILPSSLSMVLSIALESSSHLPASVCGTGTWFWLEGFLGSLESATSPCHQGSASHLGVNAPRICLRDRLPAYTGTSNRPLNLSFFVTPSIITNFGGTGIMTSCPSPTLFSLGLGPANPGTINVAQETLGLRRKRFSRFSRYLCRHSHFCALHQSSRFSFAARRTLLYHDALRRHP